MLLVDTRIDFYKQLPKNGIVAEIGVMRGVNAKDIYDICQPKQLFLIDLWYQQTKSGSGGLYNTNQWEEFYQYVLIRFKKYDNVTIIKNNSIDAAVTFNDKYFDIVYIDAGHSYESVKEDLAAWYPKIKPEGIISGHDYTDTPKNKSKQFGIVKAVDEFCKTKNLEIFMLSNVINARDWAIKV